MTIEDLRAQLIDANQYQECMVCGKLFRDTMMEVPGVCRSCIERAKEPTRDGKKEYQLKAELD